MEEPLNKQKTSTSSLISNILSNIYRRKAESQWGKFTIYNLQFTIPALICTLYILHCTFYISTAHAIVDPLSVPNNRFGIHIIQATPEESSPAASLVNSNGGDWGYITFLIEGKDKKKDKWQEFFDDLRRRHLIPVVRIATEPSGDLWVRPNPEDADSWADFLNSLNWPTKNRYIIFFNEPNHGSEWGGVVDATSYAEVLDKFIDAFKKRSEDFFILNAGFDASAPQEPPRFSNELEFIREMNQAVPGIFDKLDGWVSHSYPNPGFVGSPNATGRGTVGTWAWELNHLRSLGLAKNLPVFITETGWKHAEGISTDPSLPSAENVSRHYVGAFNNAWQNPRIVAVTPFLLSYQERLFDHFSFKKIQKDNPSPPYYPQFYAIADLNKKQGRPVQENKAQLKSGEIFSSLVSNQTYSIPLVFKNAGQSIWGDGPKISLRATGGGDKLKIETVEVPKGTKVEPGKDHTFFITLKAPESGTFKISLQLYSDETPFDTIPYEFDTQVKDAVELKAKTSLKWKKSAEGDYLILVAGPLGETPIIAKVNARGESESLPAKYLLPDYSFTFSLYREGYHSKLVTQKLKPGENVLDFGIMQPMLVASVINPNLFWQLLPFSN